MLLVAEGASGRSHGQLKRALYLPDDTKSIYKNIENLLSINSSGIELAVNQGIFPHSEYQLQPDYINTLVNQYAADFLPVDFQQQADAAKTITNYLSDRTNGQITDAISQNDLSGTILLLTSTIQFKGQWKVSNAPLSIIFPLMQFIFFPFECVFFFAVSIRNRTN